MPEVRFMSIEQAEAWEREENQPMTSTHNLYPVASIYPIRKIGSLDLESDEKQYGIWQGPDGSYAVAGKHGKWVDPAEIGRIYDVVSETGSTREYHQWTDKESWYTINASYRCQASDKSCALYVYDECDRRDLDRNRDLLKNSLSEKLTVAYGILKAAHTLEQTRAAERAATISKLVVHDGVFHADDVLCAAMAKSLNPDVWIQRTRRLDPMDIELNGNGVYIADVSGGKYDHHQPDAAVREDGAKYAACGLLYEEWKDALFNTKEGQQYFEDTYVKPIEVTDNGGERNMLSHAIGGLNPSWDQKTDWDAAFYEAVDRMSAILEAERHRVNDLGKTEPAIDDKTLMEAQKMMGAGEFLDASCKDKSLNNYMALQGDMYDGQAKDPLTAGLSALGEVNPEAAREMVDKILDEDRENVNSAFRARSIVQDAYAKSPDKTSVILESYAPWRDVLPETEAEYVLYETRGQYNIQCVPKNLAGNETKVKLPEGWLTEKPEGCKFVAPARHVCGFDTMEHAKAALDEILKDRTAQIEASKWENQKADYHLTYNNTKENIDFHGFTVQPGFWYGKDLASGENVALTADGNFYHYIESDAEMSWQEFDPTWYDEKEDIDVDPTILADGYQAPDFSSKKPFEQWLEEDYGISAQDFQKFFYGELAENVQEQYDYYQYNGFPDFAREEINLQHAQETMGIDEQNTPCVDWRCYNETNRFLLSHAQGIKPEFYIDYELKIAREDIILDREEYYGKESEEVTKPILAKDLFRYVFRDAETSCDRSIDNMESKLRVIRNDSFENTISSRGDLLLEFCKVCSNAGLDKDTVLQALNEVTAELYDHYDLTDSAAQHFHTDMYNEIDAGFTLLSLKNVKLTPGNDTVEIQQKISEHPKKCLHAILEDVAKQYTMATPAYDMSVSAMKNHYSENLQAHQEALYEAALEQGLTHDNLEYAFGEDFVTEMENREQMQQAEKNNDDLNLE